MFKIYGKVGCSSCVQAKNLLEAKGIDYEYLVLGKDYDLKTFTSIKEGHRSFPLITKDSEYVGTFVDLQKLVA